MNPYLERRWPDVHVRLISRIVDALGEELPPTLFARAEERIEMVESPDPLEIPRIQYRADIAIAERWRKGLPEVLRPTADSRANIAVMEPEFIPMAQVEDTQRWLEVRDAQEVVITVMEVLSPVNKAQKYREYVERRQRFMEAGANFVEIDLLRGGRRQKLDPTSATYQITVYRASQTERCEVYRTSLRERLPCFRVPLRPRDPDVPLDLQPLINDIYKTGRYWLQDFREPLTPPLSDEDALWARGLLQKEGLLSD